MKTLKGWEKSPNLNLGEYLKEPCRINEELYNYIAEVVSPQYCSDGIIQEGEPEFTNEDGIYHYMTVTLVNGKYFYLGVLPEFKQ